MGRWEPDARGRMISAALELYTENGFDQTTAADIAERAGVTERTFFRHFADKREVLFDGSAILQQEVVDTVAAAPESATPLDVVGAAMERAGSLLQSRREFARRRAAALAANPSLQERELLKMSTLGAAIAAALRERGTPPLAASVAADAGITIFRIGFETWIDDTSADDLAQCIRDALEQLRQLTAPS
ncbi:MAG TPA: TetR family transcriptional regulator [Leifsonia sp.]|nr:TetR family transcriptional regulator [Leifsonia sp.]